MALDPNTNDLIPTRWSLIVRLKNLDDQSSWREFYDTYWRVIYRVAIKSGLTEAEVEDVVQETVISVAQKMPQFEAEPGAGSFKGFLLAITRRRIVDQFRKRPPHIENQGTRSDATARTVIVERIPDPASLDLDAVWNLEWEKNLMDAAMERVIRKINLKQYQIHHFYVVKRWPANKVAGTLGVNIGEVYLTKHRVAGLLKKELKRLEAKMI
jgi:RNA polymerase sigma-70 factor (ECF subfamily)